MPNPGIYLYLYIYVYIYIYIYTYTYIYLSLYCPTRDIQLLTINDEIHKNSRENNFLPRDNAICRTQMLELIGMVLKRENYELCVKGSSVKEE